MTAGWTAYPNTNIKTLQPNAVTYNLYGSNSMVLSAWGGGAYDSKRNRQIFWGGGHGDYNGNEIYALYHDSVPDLSDCIVTTGGRLGRITNPGYGVPPSDYPCQDQLADGTPNSRHTYGGFVYVTHLDKMFAYGGSLSCGSGGFSTVAWTFDFPTKTWTRLSPTGQQPSHGSAVGVYFTYDPVTKLVWGKSPLGTYTFSIENNAWSELKYNDSPQPNMGYSACAIDPIRRRMIIIPRSVSATYYVDLTGSGPSGYGIQTMTTQGVTPPYGDYAGGLAFDPNTGYMVSWYSSSGTTVTEPQYIYALDQNTSPPTWLRFGPFTGYPQPSSRGVISKWQFIPPLNAFGVMTTGNENGFTFRLPDSVRQISIPNNTFVKMTYSTPPPWAPPPPGTAGGKHQRFAQCPVDGWLYHLGGDTGMSGIMEMWRYKALTDVWEQVQPQCRTDGRIQARHPDQDGWQWDTIQNHFIMRPGYQGQDLIECPNIIPGNKTLYFHTLNAARDWEIPSPEWPNSTRVSGVFGFFDPKYNTWIRFYYDGGWGSTANIYHIDTQVHEYASPLFGGSARVNQCQAAVDYEGRKAYIATTTGLLHSYNMETRTSTLIGRPPGGPVTVEEEIMCVWDSTSKRVLYAPWNLLDPVYPTHPVIRYLYAYNPADNTWESFLCGSADGLVAARTMVYDPYQNVTLFLCTHGNSLPEIDGRAFWMFRYSPSGEPPPNYPPAPPTNLRIL